MLHKWSAVEDKFPSKRELASWDEGHWISLLRFYEVFIRIKEETNEHYMSVSKEKWIEAEGFLKMPDHPFHEYLYRINRFTFSPGASEKKFFYKMSAMMRATLGYLRENPARITEKMRGIIEREPRFAWCLKQTKVVDVGAGFNIVVPDKDMPGVDGTRTQDLATFEQQLTEAIMKTTNLVVSIVESISVEDLKKMATDKKLSAIAKLVPLLKIGQGFRPGTQVFKQINVHNADRETLEKAMLEFSKAE